MNEFKTDLPLVKNNEFSDFVFTTLTIWGIEEAIILSADRFCVYKVWGNIKLDQAEIMTMHSFNRDLGFNIAIHVVKKMPMVCLFDSSVGKKKVSFKWPGESSFPVTCCGWKDSRAWGTRMLKWFCHLKCTPPPKGKCLEDMLFTNISRVSL